jgi:hypothetical protein
MHVCVCACVQACVYESVCLCVSVCMCVLVQVYARVYMSVLCVSYACTSVCVHISVYVCLTVSPVVTVAVFKEADALTQHSAGLGLALVPWCPARGREVWAQSQAVSRASTLCETQLLGQLRRNCSLQV